MRRALGVAAVIAFAAACPVSAQVPWEGPLMVSAATPPGWGFYIVDVSRPLVHPSSGGGIGVLTTLRSGGAFGYRIGLGEDRGDDVTVFGGIDVSGTLVAASDDVPVDVKWVTGGGMGVGDSFLLTVPLGISVSRAMAMEGGRVWLNPYATPRVILDLRLSEDDLSEDELDLGLAVDLGLDLSFDQGWAVRSAFSVGARNSSAIGVSFQFL